MYLEVLELSPVTVKYRGGGCKGGTSLLRILEILFVVKITQNTVIVK